MSSRRLTRIGLIAILLLGCVGCDQLSKHVVRAELALGQTHSFLADTMRLTHVENPGAFLSVGATLSHGTRIAIFQVGVGLVVLTLLAIALLRRSLSPTMAAGLTLLAASGAGNLIDRMTQDGRVTDFINMGVGPLRTGIFNVADVVGLIAVALVFLAGRQSPPQAHD